MSAPPAPAATLQARSSRFQLAVIAVAALCGLTVSMLWLSTAAKAWPGVMLQRKINQDLPVSPSTLVEVRKRVSGLDQTLLPGRHAHLPGLTGQLLITDVHQQPEQRQAMIREVEQAVRAGLARDPAEARAWARLAWLVHLRQGPAEEVLGALRMSIFCSPASRPLLLWRLETAGRYRHHWDQEFTDLIVRQTTLAMRVFPAKTAEIAEQYDLPIPVRE